MKKFYPLFTILLMLSFSVFGQQWHGIRSDVPTPIQQELLQATDDNIVIKFSVDGYFTQSVVTPNGKEDIISVEDMVSMLEAGAPDLPIYAVSAIIPDMALMRVRILDAQYTDIPNMEIAPSKGNFPRSIDPATVPFEYGEAYSNDAFYPAIRAELQEAYIWRDYRGQAVTVMPFAYNPVTKTLRVYTDLTVEIYADGFGGENQFNRSGELTSMEREFRSIYSSHFINFGQHSRYPILDEEGSMLVISHGPFMEAMEPFLEWKTTIGRQIEMVDVATIGTTSTAIKAFMVDYYNTNGLTHLLIVGDHQQVPSHSMSGGFSDHFYGYILGNDSYPEVFVGRFSSETVAHVETQVQRTIEYERDLNESDTWLSIGTGIARNEGTGNGHNGGEGDHTHMDFIRDSLLNYTYTFVHRLYDGNVPGVPNTNATAMMQAFNEGTSITNFCNHGSQTSWSVGNFNMTHVNQLTNVGKLPYIWSVACDNGRFTNGTCFAEAWMRATHNGEPSGAIATMMSWISQPWQPPMTGQDEMVTILVEKRDHIKRTMGGVSINGSAKMITAHGTTGRTTHDTWLLFGDPSLMLRTAAPTAIVADYMPAAFLGFTEFTVTANAEDAIVSLTMNGEILGTAYVQDGVAVVEFAEPLNEPGEMTIAIMGWNKVTYINTIEVIPAAGPFVAISDFMVDDSEGGNNNGQVDFNETITLGVALKNLGVEDATEVMATISTDSPYVVCLDEDQAFGTIAPDQVVMIEDAFQFVVEDGIPNNTLLSFNVDIEGAEDSWTGSINLTAYAPEFAVGNFLINDMTHGNGNGRLDPGETADIVVQTHNNGGAQSVEAIGSLLLNDPWITLNNTTHSFGSFGAGFSLNAFFNVTVDPNTPIGYAFPFSYAVEAGAYSAEKDFMAKVGLILEDFESGDFSAFDWNFSGHQPWQITSANPYEGTYSARSGNINHSQQTRMILQYEVGAEDTISFFRRVSSEANYDYLRFYINGTKVDEWSGNVGWGRVAYPVTAGMNTFIWEYMKDPIVSSGEDAAWVDYISFPPPLTTSGGAGADASICETETHQLDAYAANYISIEWTSSGTGTFDDPSILNPVYTPGAEDIEDGEVTLTLTIEGQNTTINDEVLISIHKNPVVFAGENAAICWGGSFEIEDSHGDHYDVVVWETSGSGEFDDTSALHPVYTPSAEDYAVGMVTLSISAHGFESCDVATSSFELHFHALPTASISGNPQICLGEDAQLTVELTGTGPWAVSFDNNIGSNTIESSPWTLHVSPEVTTTYAILAVNDINCEGEVSGEATVTLDYAPLAPVKPAGQDTIDLYLVQQTAYIIEDVDNADMYQWQIEPETAGELTADGTTVTIDWNPDYRGTATLLAIAGNDCGMSEGSPALEIELYSTVGLDENALLQASVYPNPSAGVFTLQLTSLRKGETIISVRNIVGELVYAEAVQLENRTTTKMLNLSHLSNGTYILSVESNDGRTFKRIMINK